MLALAGAAIVIGAGYLAVDLQWFHSNWELVTLGCIVGLVVAGAILEGALSRPSTVAHSRFAVLADLDGIAESVLSAKAQAAIEMGDQGPYVGEFSDGQLPYVLRYQGGLHMLCFGPPGSGKSMSLVVPNLAHLRRSGGQKP